MFVLFVSEGLLIFFPNKFLFSLMARLVKVLTMVLPCDTSQVQAQPLPDAIQLFICQAEGRIGKVTTAVKGGRATFPSHYSQFTSFFLIYLPISHQVYSIKARQSDFENQLSQVESPRNISFMFFLELHRLLKDELNTELSYYWLKQQCSPLYSTPAWDVLVYGSWLCDRRRSSFDTCRS